MAAKKISKANEKYMKELFAVVRKFDRVAFPDKNAHFNNTELRLLGEVLSVKAAGKRVISTQLADKLGVTRSAVSLIVGGLVERGVLKRVPDDVDKKIAYIEITEEAMADYKQDIACSSDFIGSVVEQFGKEDFETFCTLANRFMDVFDKERTVRFGSKEARPKRKYTRKCLMQ